MRNAIDRMAETAVAAVGQPPAPKTPGAEPGRDAPGCLSDGKARRRPCQIGRTEPEQMLRTAAAATVTGYGVRRRCGIAAASRHRRYAPPALAGPQRHAAGPERAPALRLPCIADAAGAAGSRAVRRLFNNRIPPPSGDIARVHGGAPPQGKGHSGALDSGVIRLVECGQAVLRHSLGKYDGKGAIKSPRGSPAHAGIDPNG